MRDQILRSGDDLFFADENGFSLTRSEFVDLIEGKNKSANKVPQNWIDEIKEVLRDDSKRKEIHLTNWMRIRETHIWDHATLIIKDSGDE